jgi:hypothetical protein
VSRSKEETLEPMAVILIPFVSLLLFVMLFEMGNCLPNKTGRVLETYDLIALTDTSKLSGSSFLGSGTIDEIEYYVYYYNDSAGIHQGKVKVSETTLHYWDINGSGKLEVVSVDPSSRWEYLLAFPSWSPRNEIYIPNGSISNSFNLDLRR